MLLTWAMPPMAINIPDRYRVRKAEVQQSDFRRPLHAPSLAIQLIYPTRLNYAFIENWVMVVTIDIEHWRDVETPRQRLCIDALRLSVKLIIP